MADCPLPTRTETPLPPNGSHDLEICYIAAWSAYQDARLACEIGNTPSCQDKLDCEADAWANYQTAIGFCDAAHGGIDREM